MGRISVRYILLLAMLAWFVPVLVVQVGVYARWYQTRERAELQANQHAARQVSDVFEAHLTHLSHQAFTLGQALTHLTPAQGNALLAAARREETTVRRISWISPKGWVLASSDPAYLGLSVKTRPFFQQIQRSRQWVFSGLTKAPKDGELVVSVGRAIRAADGRLQGILIIAEDPDRLPAVLNIDQSVQGEIALIDPAGFSTDCTPEHHLSWRREQWGDAWATIMQAMGGQDGAGAFLLPFTGRVEMAAFVPVRGTGWVVAAHRPRDEVIIPITQRLWHDSAILLLTLLLFGLLALALHEGINRPLTRLRDAARALGRGEHAEPIAPGGPSEAHELAEAFNTMVQALQEKQASLYASQEALRALMDASPESAFLTDTDGRVLAANEVTARRLGLSLEDFLGSSTYDSLPSELADDRRRSIAEVVRTGKPACWIDICAAYTQENYVVPIRDAAQQVVRLAVFSHDITSRSRAETERQALLLQAELRAAELDAVFEAMADAMVIYDHDGIPQRANAAAVRTLGEETLLPVDGTPADRLRIIQAMRICHEDGRPVAVEALPSTRALRGGIVRDDVYRFTDLQGQERVILSSATPLRRGGKIVGAVATWHDITEREQTEETLRESEKRFRTVLDNSLDAAYRRNLQSDGYDYMSPVIEQMTGFSAETFSRMPLDEVLARIHPDDVPEVTQEIDQAMLTGSSTMEYRLRGRDGAYCWLADHFTILKDEQGRPQYRVGIVRDITVRKRIEEDLERQHAFMNTVIDMLPIPMTIFSPDGTVLRRSRAAKEFYQPMLDADDDHIEVLDAATRVPIPPARQSASLALAGETVTNQQQVLLFPDGREIPVIAFATPIRVDDRIVAAVVAFQDVSALKEADQAKDEFLAVLSHEMKTPLTSIIGWTEMALKRRLTAFYPDALVVIQRNARRQQALIDEMLDMSHLLHRKFSITPQPGDLGELARQAVENIRFTAEEKGLTLVFASSEAPLPVHADPLRLQQCLGNLLQNSLKFTPTGGVITVACRQEGREAVVSIRDTGRGIDPQALEAIFKPFCQFNRDERTGGLGLGLAVTRGIIELHQGAITAASEGEGQGSTFTIRLPLVE
ncbi:MAG: PAS domain S-box protein [Armatimonadota bacterium]